MAIQTSIDAVGRIVVPKQLRDALGLEAGATIDISMYGTGLALVPAGRTARVVTEDGRLIADASIPVTDDTVFGLLDAGRR